MFCVNCGNQLGETSKFCNKCGNPIGNNQIRKTEVQNEALVDDEIQRAIYKLENEDIDEAEKIFENLAFTYHDPTAWTYIGMVKLYKLDSGETNVQQALNCFIKASKLSPSLKEQHQNTYCEISMQQIEKFRDYYLEIKQQAKKAKSSRRWNFVLMGLSAGIGNSTNKNNGNQTFRAIAGAGGAAYALQQANKNFERYKNAEQLLNFFNETIKQLVAGIKSYCSENQAVYQGFLDKMSQLNLSSFVQ